MFRLSIQALFTCFCAAVVAPAPTNAQDNLSASFEDWHTFCDKGRICAAYTYSGWKSAQNPSSGDVFSLRRQPTGGGWSMSITFDKVEPKLALGVEVSVIRMGHDQIMIPPFYEDTLVLHGGRVITGNADKHELYLLGASAENLMQQLRMGDILDFEFGGCDDEFLYTGFSLAGITAALAWVDKVQGQPQGSIKVVHTARGTEEVPFPNCVE